MEEGKRMKGRKIKEIGVLYQGDNRRAHEGSFKTLS